jgi:hypothetical protein
MTLNRAMARDGLSLTDHGVKVVRALLVEPRVRGN